MRTKLPDAIAAKLATKLRSRRRPRFRSAAQFPRSGHSLQAVWPKSKPDVRCARVRCLTYGQSRLSISIMGRELGHLYHRPLYTKLIAAQRGKRPFARTAVKSDVGRTAVQTKQMFVTGIFSLANVWSVPNWMSDEIFYTVASWERNNVT